MVTLPFSDESAFDMTQRCTVETRPTYYPYLEHYSAAPPYVHGKSGLRVDTVSRSFH